MCCSWVTVVVSDIHPAGCKSASATCTGSSSWPVYPALWNRFWCLIQNLRFSKPTAPNMQLLIMQPPTACLNLKMRSCRELSILIKIQHGLFSCDAFCWLWYFFLFGSVNLSPFQTVLRETKCQLFCLSRKGIVCHLWHTQGHMFYVLLWFFNKITKFDPFFGVRDWKNYWQMGLSSRFEDSHLSWCHNSLGRAKS